METENKIPTAHEPPHPEDRGWEAAEEWRITPRSEKREIPHPEGWGDKNKENPQKTEDGFSPALMTFAAIVFSAIIIYAAVSDAPRIKTIPQKPTAVSNAAKSALEKAVLPQEGVILPAAKWNDLGAKMISVGIIDAEKFETFYAERGGISEEEKKLLYAGNNDNLKVTPENSAFLLNLLWALGLGNKNEILDKGPMADPRYGGGGNFASTGGWTLGSGDAMEYYSRHLLLSLTPEQQAMVEQVSKNIYRPCCDNPAYFPDCNHGIAMLGLLELMASQGASENEMYRAALKINSYWFPDTYLTIAKYLEKKGIAWEKADPKEILGKNYSSFSGYQRVLLEVTPPERAGGGSCGV